MFENLTPFYIKTRYPAFKEDLAKIANNNFTQENIKMVDGFLKWLKQSMK